MYIVILYIPMLWTLLISGKYLDWTRLIQSTVTKKLEIESQKEVLVSPKTKRRILWPFQLQRLKNEWHVRIDHSEELRKEAAKEKYSRTREK